MTTLQLLGNSMNQNWEQLGAKDKRILASVLTTGSPERSQRQLGISNGTFYRHWHKLKPIYEQTMSELPKLAQQVLLSNSVRAAQTLVMGLESESEKIRQQTAKEILNRVIPKEFPQEGLKRKISIEEWTWGTDMVPK